jgi:hypothetical protein
MLLEGRIETTNLHEIIAPQVSFGLDTAEKRAYSTNGLLFKQSVSRLKDYYFLETRPYVQMLCYVNKLSQLQSPQGHSSSVYCQ